MKPTWGALVRMYEQAVKTVSELEPAQQDTLCARLGVVRDRSQAIGYAVAGKLAELFAEHRGDD